MRRQCQSWHYAVMKQGSPEARKGKKKKKKEDSLLKSLDRTWF